MAKVAWSPSALADLDEITGFIAQDDKSAAQRVGLALWNAGNSLGDHRHRGRIAATGLRELVAVRPYLIRYRAWPERVLILEVRHSARRPR